MAGNTLKCPTEMLHCAPAHKGFLSCLGASQARPCQIDSTWHPSLRSSDCYRVRGEQNNATIKSISYSTSERHGGARAGRDTLRMSGVILQRYFSTFHHILRGFVQAGANIS